MNVDCIFLNFFDGHDIWHFLGAAGVFFAFLCIFTLDEDLKGKKSDKSQEQAKQGVDLFAPIWFLEPFPYLLLF